MANHFVSASCRGEKCGMCLREGKKVEPTHKVGEEFFHDIPTDCHDPEIEHDSYAFPYRHNLTQYLCCDHFAAVMGPLAAQWCGIQKTEEDA